MACFSEAEESFGPLVAACRGSFDFTLLFEDVFFKTLPSCLFIVGCGVRYIWLRKRPVRINLGLLYVLKFCTTASFCILELLSLIFICKKRIETPKTSIPSTVLSFLGAMFFVTLSYFEHTRSCRPSFLLVFYLCITAILRSAIVRTYWSLDGKGLIFSINLSILVIQLAMIVLESCSKRKLFLGEVAMLSGEETAGFLDRSLFFWLDNIMINGYRRTLTAADLQPIDKRLRTLELSKRFEHIIRGRSRKESGLLSLTLQSIGVHLISPVFPRICLTGFTFAQPFLATALIRYLTNGPSGSKNDGYGLIGATFLVYVGIAISSGWYWHLTHKAITMMRGGLLEVVFARLLELSYDKTTEAKVMTLMISDVQRITSASVHMHELWAGPLETGLALWLLWRQVGPSSLTVGGVALIFTALSMSIGKLSGPQQKKWLEATEKRINETKNMLASLKAIKMTGANKRVSSTVKALRLTEFHESKLFRNLMVAGVLSAYATLTLAPILVFGVYTAVNEAKKEYFNATRLFTSLILISLLASPLIRLLQIIPAFGAARGCFARFEEYLEQQERKDRRIYHAGEIFDPEGNGNESGSQELNKRGTLEKIPGLTTSNDIPAVLIKGADFGWSDKAQLKSVNLRVQNGEHIAITGPVGCGKTLLLQAILGELEPLCGTLQVGSKDIGYCSQNPWLENRPALENVFRSYPVDGAWQQKIIYACALDSLVNSLDPKQTIGSSGAKLSNGERQRLALARTIAFRPSIILLDNVFSAIDRASEEHITKSLFGPQGILRQLGTTVIEIVHDEISAIRADRTYRIDETGQCKPCDPKDFPRLHKKNDIDIVQATIPDTSSTAKKAITKVSQSGNKDIASLSDKAVYWTYFNAIGQANMVIFFLFGAAFAFTMKFPNVWVQWWSNANAGTSPGGTSYWVGIYALLQILPLFMLCIWLQFLMHRVVPTSGVELHRKLLSTTLRATFTFINNIDSGNLINRFNQDLMLIDLSLPLQLINTVSSGLTSIMQAVLIVVAAVYTLVTLPVLFAILYLVQHFYLRTSKQLRHLELESNSALHTKLSETCSGLVTIRAHGLQDIFKEEWEERLDRSQEPLYLLYAVQRWLQLVMNLIVAGLAVTVTGAVVGMRDKITGGTVGVALLNMTTMGETMTNFITSWTTMETSMAAIARIKEFEKNTPVEATVSSPVTVSPGWPASGGIRVENLSASYNPEAERPIWALHNISVEIRAGEKIAICGRSGSGKSTFLMTLLALIEGQKGTIIIDQIDIAHVERSLLRSRFHVISQDTFLQGDTVRNALQPGENHSDEAVLDVLAECALLEKVNASSGLETKMSDLNLSSGEAQLFALARTILGAAAKKGSIVLLDEATSSIDRVTEQRIMKLIAERLPGKTIISVLHRLEVALEYDRILVLEHGELAHLGTPAEVLRQSELFSSLR
ncbi:putative ATP-binding cassette transporter [Tricladium varicosporioides]|nr:putative ATP-binding cassette transporter [Hymenoscyphus varicosporioides]